MAAPSDIRAIIFTDLIGSTALKQRLGDRKYGELLTLHDALFRDLLSRHGGQEEQQTGDGFLALFENSCDAVRTAVEFIAALRQADRKNFLRARIGIHQGEVFWIKDAHSPNGRKAVGLATDTAARIMDLAREDQILVSRAPFDSARQHLGVRLDEHDLAWRAHGPYRFAGIDEAVDVHEVGIRGISPLEVPPDSAKGRNATALGDEITLGWRPAVDEPVPGNLRWRLRERLGQGGFGEVWLAIHCQTGDLRAFKFCFKADRLRTLKRELTLFRLLKEVLGERPDIARLYDVNLDDPPYYLEMEYTAGGDLEEWVKVCGGIAQIDLDARIAIVAQVAEALAAAHSVGVIHKDIKPSNILMNDTDNGPLARLTDFGISQLLDRAVLQQAGITQTGFTHTGQTFMEDRSSQTGTRMYMAPEIFAGRPASIQTDIYALGVLLYQMARGDLERPLAQGWQRDIDDPVLREDIAACVEGDVERRLESAGALAERLRRIDSRREKYQHRKLLERAAQRRGRFLTIGAVVVIVLLGISLSLLYGIQRARREQHIAVAMTRRAQVSQDRERRQRYYTTVRFCGELLRDERFHDVPRMLDEAPTEFREWEWGYLKRLAQPELHRIQAHKGYVKHIAISPDSRNLASVGRDNRLVMWNTADWSEAWETTLESSPWDLAFNTKGRCVAVGMQHGFAVYDNAAGRVLFSGGQTGQKSTFLCFSPSGDRLYLKYRSGLVVVRRTSDWSILSSQAFPPNSGRVLLTGNGRYLLLCESIGTSHSSRVHVLNSETLEKDAEFQIFGSTVAVCGDWVIGIFHRWFGVWEAPSGKRLVWKNLRSTTAMAKAVPNIAGDVAVTVGLRQESSVVDLATGRVVGAIDNGIATHDAAYAPNGSFLATAGHDGAIRIWPVSLDECKLRPRQELNGGALRTGTEVSFSPDGALVCVSGWGPPEIPVWRTSDWTMWKRIHVPGKGPRIGRFHPKTGEIVACTSRSLVLYDIESGCQTRQIPICTYAGSLGLDRVGRYIAVGYTYGDDTTSGCGMDLLRLRDGKKVPLEPNATTKNYWLESRQMAALPSQHFTTVLKPGSGTPKTERWFESITQTPRSLSLP